jgi:hypothetical protein
MRRRTLHRVQGWLPGRPRGGTQSAVVAPHGGHTNRRGLERSGNVGHCDPGTASTEGNPASPLLPLGGKQILSVGTPGLNERDRAAGETVPARRHQRVGEGQRASDCRRLTIARGPPHHHPACDRFATGSAREPTPQGGSRLLQEQTAPGLPTPWGTLHCVVATPLLGIDA